MIQLSPRGKIQYSFLNLIVLLLLVYASAFLLGSLFQLPVHPLPSWLREIAITRLGEQSAKLLLLTAFLAAGLSMTPVDRTEGGVLWMHRLWFVLVFVTTLASPFLDSPWTDLVLAPSLLAVLIRSHKSADDCSCLRVWQIGMLLISACLVAAPVVEGGWAEVLRLFQLHVAYGISSVSLVFWLMGHFSAVDGEWIDDGARIVAGLVFLGGSLISIAPLGLPPIISLGATPLVLLSFMILAGHNYRALGLRNADASLAPHWIGIATLFWLIGGGFLGAITLQPGVYAASQGTALSDTGAWLTLWVNVSVALAFVNASASELRGDNRRVSGYVPLWLIGFGVGLSTIVGACRGVVQIYLGMVTQLDAAAIQESLLPLTALWVICLLAVGCGVLTYALGFRVRRPRIKVVLG